jgi:hypothetical protein
LRRIPVGEEDVGQKTSASPAWPRRRHLLARLMLTIEAVSELAVDERGAFLVAF